ncbi:histidinol-phosphatase [Spirochaetia bacterium]|nr:histidinol-phosphatase [Spirochaetia bacterium]
MKYSCIHTHTTFCDGRDDIETYCQAAWERGFVSIGFSAHAPVGRKAGLVTDWHLGDARLTEYLDTVRDARRRWEGRLPVYLGLEVDYIEGRMGPADADYRDLGLDYLIGSVHYVFPPDGGEPIAVDGSPEEFAADVRSRFNHDGELLAETYWDTLLAMVNAGGFDVLGHFDLVKKNNEGNRWFKAEGERYRKKAESLIGPIAESASVVEVNTGGLIRGRTREAYPSPSLLRLLGTRGVPVTITADAHEASHLGGFYAEARETLRNSGYTETVLFAGRQARKPIWTKEPLEI